MTLLIGGETWRDAERALDGPFNANASLKLDLLLQAEEAAALVPYGEGQLS